MNKIELIQQRFYHGQHFLFVHFFTKEYFYYAIYCRQQTNRLNNDKVQPTTLFAQKIFHFVN